MEAPSYIDLKVTVWQRIHLPDDLKEAEVKELYEAVSKGEPIPDWVYNTKVYELETLVNTETIHHEATELVDVNHKTIHSITHNPID